MARPQPATRRRGSSLIEVLVALTVTAISLLALAALMATSMTLSRHQRHRQAAQWLAEDLAGQMRTNLAAARTGDYTWARDDALPPEDPDCAEPSACTPDEQARIDLAVWLGRVAAQLPQGAAEVRHDPDEQTVDVWVAWVDAGLPPPTGARQVCPSDWPAGVATPARCVHLRVAL